jgi:hypothetical protein
MDNVVTLVLAIERVQRGAYPTSENMLLGRIGRLLVEKLQRELK